MSSTVVACPARRVIRGAGDPCLSHELVSWVFSTVGSTALRGVQLQLVG